MIEKLLYFPIFHHEGEPGCERSDIARQWFERFLIPAGLATHDEEEANAYYVATGDGGFTRAVREKHEKGKLFFGDNRGTEGFLLNPIHNINQIPKTIEDLHLITVRLMKGTFYPKTGDIASYIAFNDVLCGGGVEDFIRFRITGELSHFPNRLNVQGNGVVVSTPQGTTGYALNNRGSSAVVPLDSDHWYISGIATGPYPADIVSPQKITVEIESRASVNGFADGRFQKVENIEKMEVTPTGLKVTLGFLKNVDFAALRTQKAQRIERGE